MSLRRPLELVLVLLLSNSLLSPANARESGLWRLPSSTPQYFGYGYGPGHHAPMIRSPGYQPPHVQRLRFIPAKQGPFCNTGNCSMGRGYQSMPIQADLWALDAMSAPMLPMPQAVPYPHPYPHPYPQHAYPAPHPAQMQPLPAMTPTPVQPQPERATTPAQAKPAATPQAEEAKPVEKNEALPVPSPVDEPEDEDLLGEDDLEAGDLEGDFGDDLDDDLDIDDPLMPEAEPLPQPESKDDTPRTDQARGPRVWNCR